LRSRAGREKALLVLLRNVSQAPDPVDAEAELGDERLDKQSGASVEKRKLMTSRHPGDEASDDGADHGIRR
jgi:hypothetical protein